MMTKEQNNNCLNIAKNHLENLGGSIWFESKEHLGTTFTVTIPNNAK